MKRFILNLIIIFFLISCSTKTEKIYEQNIENSLSFSENHLKSANLLIYKWYVENSARTRIWKIKTDSVFTNYILFDSICKNYLSGKSRLDRDSLLQLYFSFENKIFISVQNCNYIDQSSIFKLDSVFLTEIHNEKLLTLLVRNNLAMNSTNVIKFFLSQLDASGGCGYVNYDEIDFIKEPVTQSNSYSFSICSRPLAYFPEHNHVLIDSIIFNNKKISNFKVPSYYNQGENKLVRDERLYTMTLNSLNNGTYIVYGNLVVDYGISDNVKIKSFNYKFNIDKK